MAVDNNDIDDYGSWNLCSLLAVRIEYWIHSASDVVLPLAPLDSARVLCEYPDREDLVYQEIRNILVCQNMPRHFATV